MLNNLTLYNLRKGKVVKTSIYDMVNQEKAERGTKVAVVILIAIWILMLFAPNFQMVLFFFFSGLIIGLLHLKKVKTKRRKG